MLRCYGCVSITCLNKLAPVDTKSREVWPNVSDWLCDSTVWGKNNLRMCGFCKSFFHYWALLSYSIHFQPFPLVIFDAYFLFTYSLWCHDQIWVLSMFILIKIQIYSENHPNSCNTFWRANDHDKSMNMQNFYFFFPNQHQGFLLIGTPLLGKCVEIKILGCGNKCGK